MATYSIPSIATFFKVSKEQFARDYFHLEENDPVEKIMETPIFNEIYSSIRLPSRATVGSAGYDFYMPDSIEVSKRPVLIWTGVRVNIEPGWMLMLFPRSGLGFKYGMRLLNTTGIVDQDYFFADNEGHIATKLVADTPVQLKAGDRFMQGILVPYGIAKNDYDLKKQRVGGFGSTGGM